MIQTDLMVEGATQLLTLASAANRPQRGEDMRDIGLLRIWDMTQRNQKTRRGVRQVTE